jgi:hypothetical protein
MALSAWPFVSSGRAVGRAGLDRADRLLIPALGRCCLSIRARCQGNSRASHHAGSCRLCVICWNSA